MNDQDSKTISLVLGSGGARGLAHIGVIRALERQGWKIDAIVGSSMGALIGGFYAAGKLHDYTEWVEELTEFNVLRYLDIAWGGSGLLKGQILMETLRDFVGDHQIEELAVPLTIIATDVLSRREVWLSSGNLFDAIRASIAVPTVFTPHVINGRPLLDGGILNPVPIAPALLNTTDAIIAVSLSGVPQTLVGGSRRAARPDHPTSKPHRRYQTRIKTFIDELQDRLGLESRQDAKTASLSLTDSALLSLDAMQARIARCMLAAYPPDLLIEIPINTCKVHEFYRAGEVIAAGEYWGELAIRRFVNGNVSDE